MLHVDRSAVPEGFDWERGCTYTTRDRLPAGAAPQRFQTWNQPELLAPLDCTVEAKERVDTWGNTLAEVDEEHLREQLVRLDGEVDVLVVALMNSYANGANERQVERVAAEVLPGVSIALSHQVLPEQCEYERAATTVANSYIRPVVDDYLNLIEERNQLAGFDTSIQVLRADGGLAGPDSARELPVNLIAGGPAGGLVGAVQLCGVAGHKDLITLDMGGCSTEAGVVVGGKLPIRREIRVADLVVRAPALDVHTIGSGGGSIVKVPQFSRALRVGPESANANPGPACYGRGGQQATLTDANCVLGHLPGRGLLGGQLELDREAAQLAVQHVGEALELATAAAAEGIIDVANEAILGAMRVMLVRKGLDSQKFSLVPFGGAGPLHACAIGKALGSWPVLVPPSPGLMGAMGALASSLRSVKGCTVGKALEEVTPTELRTVLELLAEDARTDLERDGIPWETQIVSYEVDMRFKGEALDMVTTIEVDIESMAEARNLEQLKEILEMEHLRAYTFSLSEGHEVVSVRSVVTGPPHWVKLLEIGAGLPEPPLEALVGVQEQYYGGTLHEAAVWDRSLLLCGNELEGPALVLEDNSTTLIQVGCAARVDKYGLLVISPSPGAVPRNPIDSNASRVDLEVIELALRATKQEMDAVVLRTAMSPGIREQREQHPVISDPLGHMVMGQFGSFIPSFLQTYTQEVYDGDVILLNDPYTCRGATSHLNNYLVLTPIYFGGVLVGWASMFGHMTDVGGMQPGSVPNQAQEVFQEGLMIPPTKLYSKGVLNLEVQQLLLHNVRIPEWNRCDLKALVASCEVCKIRVQQLCARFGRETYLQSLALLLRRSWSSMHEIIQTMTAPLHTEWRYYFEDYVDDDGQGHGPHRISCSMDRVFHETTQEYHIHFDFTGTDPQTPSAINLYQNIEQFKMLVGSHLTHFFDPEMSPNDGFYPLIEVHIPKGTILNPTFPAAVSCSAPVLGRLLDVVNGLLGQHAPELMCAAGYSDQPTLQYYGQDDGRGKPFMYYGVLYGGVPGKPVGDGPDGHSIWPSYSSVPNEFLERELPIRVEARDTVVDSGGAGLHRGGNGVKLVYRLLADGCISIHDDRWLTKPWGVNGGRAAQGSSKYIYRVCADDQMSTDMMELVPAKCDQFPVKAGDVLVFVTWGGGGWGNPLARDVNLVWQDMNSGLISIQGARNNYGVVMTKQDGVDLRETAALRQKLQKEQLAMTEVRRHHDLAFGPHASFDFGWKFGIRATEESVTELRANCKANTGYDPPQPNVVPVPMIADQPGQYAGGAGFQPYGSPGKWTPYDEGDPVLAGAYVPDAIIAEPMPIPPDPHAPHIPSRPQLPTQRPPIPITEFPIPDLAPPEEVQESIRLSPVMMSPPVERSLAPTTMAPPSDCRLPSPPRDVDPNHPWDPQVYFDPAARAMAARASPSVVASPDPLMAAPTDQLLEIPVATSPPRKLRDGMMADMSAGPLLGAARPRQESPISTRDRLAARMAQPSLNARVSLEEKRSIAEARALAEVAQHIVPRRFHVSGFGDRSVSPVRQGSPVRQPDLRATSPQESFLQRHMRAQREAVDRPSEAIPGLDGQAQDTGLSSLPTSPLRSRFSVN